MTEDLCRSDSYMKSCEAVVAAIGADGAIRLDRTVFYPSGGGQPGDAGRVIGGGGRDVAIASAIYGPDGTPGSKPAILHIPVPGGSAFAVGESVTAELAWEQRYQRMRAHTGLHLLCAIVPYPVTGGQVGDAQGRLDFDIPEASLDKDELTEKLNALIAANHPVTARFISDQELLDRSELVRTMSVKPPMGRGGVRLVEIAGVDLQPCGGTHVRFTKEIGRAVVTKIEKKGAINRRIRVEFTEAG